MKKIRILVADDHAVVRTGLISYLGSHKHLEIVGEAVNGLDAIAQARAVLPDLILMDLDMPKLNGLSATEMIHRKNPNIKILILSANPLKDHWLRISKSGASGCLSKRTPMPELIETIKRIISGESKSMMLFPQQEADSKSGIHKVKPRLSPREREVLVAITEGLSNKEIADRLGMAPRTVETHRERMTKKLNIRTTAGLTRYAIAEGLVPLS
jgi:two-component system NarL family response regulator